MGTSNSHGRAEDRKEHWLIDDCRSAISGELDDLRAKINELGNKMVAMQTKLEAEVKSSAKKSKRIDEFSKRTAQPGRRNIGTTACFSTSIYTSTSGNYTSIAWHCDSS